MSEAGAAGKGRESGLLWWPRRRSVVLDSALALVSGVECVLQAAAFADRTGLPSGPLALLGALAGLTLLVRRRRPLAVLLVAIAVLPAQMGNLLALVGLYTLASSEAPRRITGALAAMLGVGTMVVTYLLMDQSLDPHDPEMPVWFSVLVAALFGVVAVVPPVLLGMYVRARRRLVESLRDRADGLERELALLAERAEERAEWARSEERTRIAREMHDVVAHRVSLMVVHSAALQAIARKDPEKAAENAALVGDMGRQALTELRTMLGVLRADQKSPAGAAAPAGPGVTGAGAPGGAFGGAEQRAEDGQGRPGPSLDQVAGLVEQSRAAGMAVELAVEGEERAYAPQVEQTAYRLVQEALTNVHKHAAGARARVRLACREGEVAVLVQNEAPAGGGGGPSGAGLPSGGNGLVGMRERVTGLGGGFVSGPTEGGGFRVSAVIPDRAGSRRPAAGG
ncbi:histidine kinase [Streptomyces sodiiphilus]|uniref:histidine kinase n=1 Tax=Streptomyces sodiiphilus TaxID=226217 RepID=A0ABN2PAR2_9ACTN